MSTRLRVATFNIRNGRAFDGCRSWPFRRRATADAIRGLDADVVGLQEVYGFQLRWLLRRLPSRRAVGDGRSGRGRGERCPLLWDPARLRLLHHETRWFGATPDVAGSVAQGARFPRVATIARFEVVGEGTVVQIVSTHLDAHDGAVRTAAATQLAGWLDEGPPRLVLGDLNAGPDSAAVAALVAAGLRDVVPASEGGTEHGFTGRTDRRRIDHVLVGGPVDAVSARVEHPRPGGRLPSDHWPVVADLVVG